MNSKKCIYCGGALEMVEVLAYRAASPENEDVFDTVIWCEECQKEF